VSTRTFSVIFVFVVSFLRGQKSNLLAVSLSAERRACTRRNIRKPHQSSRAAFTWRRRRHHNL